MKTCILAFKHDVSGHASLLIARVTGAPVHVALLFGEECIEAVALEGVRKRVTADLLSQGEWHMVPIDMTPDGVERAYQFATAQIGKRYDWIGVTCTWWLGRIARNGDPNRWFCSELAAAALLQGGVALQPPRAGRFTPKRLWTIVRALRLQS